MSHPMKWKVRWMRKEETANAKKGRKKKRKKIEWRPEEADYANRKCTNDKPDKGLLAFVDFNILSLIYIYIERIYMAEWTK